MFGLKAAFTRQSPYGFNKFGLHLFMRTILPTAFLLLAYLSCTRAPTNLPVSTDLYAHITDAQAKALIKAAIQEAGGWENWVKIRELSYQKNFELYSESGSLEQRYEQTHRYIYQPEQVLEIRSVEGGDTLITRLQEGLYSRVKNGEWLTEADPASLEKAINTSTFVIGHPFKLLDPGTQVRYLGPDTLYNGIAVEAIEATYDAAAHSNHSSSDAWIFYFVTDRPILVASLVDAGDHFSLVENLSFQQAGGISWPMARKSYRATASGDTLYLRASYWYDAWQCSP